MLGRAGLRLAYAAYRAGQIDQAAEMAVLAFGDPAVDDILAPQDENEQEADDEAGDQQMVDLLEDGEQGRATTRQGETPIAFVQAVQAAVRQLDRAGQRDLADELVAACERAGLVVPREPVEAAAEPAEAPGPVADPKVLAGRWAGLIARHVAAGRIEEAAAVLVAVGSRSKQFLPGDPDTEVNKQLGEMLDQLGYDNLMHVTERRRKALESAPHNMTLLWPQPAVG
jgi:hypothetical protein